MERKPLHIVLVDDDLVDVMTLKRAFHKANFAHALYEASNGVEALELLRSGVVPWGRRLVLLDINMPKMNGLEFLREVRADPELQALTVVVLTTSNEERDRLEAYRHHVAGYLVKPVAFGDFVELMVALNHYWTLAEL